MQIVPPVAPPPWPLVGRAQTSRGPCLPDRDVAAPLTPGRRCLAGRSGCPRKPDRGGRRPLGHLRSRSLRRRRSKTQTCLTYESCEYYALSVTGRTLPTVTVTIEADQQEALRRIKREEGIPTSFVVRAALAMWLEAKGAAQKAAGAKKGRGGHHGKR
jgi:hypothetical protein